MEDLLNVLGWLFSIVTVVGIGFVVVLIAKNHRANWLVFSLAVADFGVGIVISRRVTFLKSMACNLRIYVAFFWFFLHSSKSVKNLCSSVDLG